MQHEKVLNRLLKEIEQATTSFNQDVPAIQRQLYKKLLMLFKDLELSGDRILNSVENIRKIGALKKEISNLILSDKYLESVDQFKKAFETVTILQRDYFSALVGSYKTTGVMRALQRDAITATVEALTEAGITANVTEGIQAVLRRNITTGGSFSDLAEEMRSALISSPEKTGMLERYTRTYTVDTLNTYSAIMGNVISDDLGLEWFMYNGSLKPTSREWCVHMVDKKYIHLSELNTIMTDNVNGAKVCGEQIPCNRKTKLPRGMKAETTVNNLRDLRGGWECNHQFNGLSEILVPKEVRIKTYEANGIKHNDGRKAK